MRCCVGKSVSVWSVGRSVGSWVCIYRVWLLCTAIDDVGCEMSKRDFIITIRLLISLLLLCHFYGVLQHCITLYADTIVQKQQHHQQQLISACWTQTIPFYSVPYRAIPCCTIVWRVKRTVFSLFRFVLVPLIHTKTFSYKLLSRWDLYPTFFSATLSFRQSVVCTNRHRHTYTHTHKHTTHIHWNCVTL